jgi:hypothetical protein
MRRYENFSVGTLDVDKILNASGNDITYGANPSGGMDYFVDNNYGSTGNDGLTWMTALKTLAGAITLSNANIANDPRIHHGGFCSRNRIFFRGDQETATLVTQPEKCDVIGVGSDSGYPMAGLMGNHAPADGHFGTRWYNIRFIPKTAAPIFTLGSTSGNPEFHGCLFDADGDAVATTGITTAAVSRLKVIGCEFTGNTTGFSTAAISIGAGAGVGITIADNLIYSASIGILIAGHSGANCSLLRNFIKSTGICISASGSVFNVIGNRGITLNAPGTAGAGAVICNQFLSCDNRFTTSNTAFTYPLLGEDANGEA